jgi:proline iminopeptidase
MNLEPIDPKIDQGEFLVEINGLKLWYKVSGTGPVCIIPTPGWGISIEYLLHLCQLEDTFTMVYLETRGTGRSQAPPSTTEYTWDHFTADLDALRQHLHQNQIWLMGHSQGGMLVMHYAISHPKKLAGLVILNSSPGYDNDFIQDSTMHARVLGQEQAWSKILDSLLFSSVDQSDAELEDLDRLPIDSLYWDNPENARQHAEVFAATTSSNHPYRGVAHSHLAVYDFASHLEEITAPTLIVTGISDSVCPVTQAERLHRGILNSKLLVIEKTGHFPWLEATDAFFKGVREFLPKLGY